MPAEKIDGSAIAKSIREEIKAEVDKIIESGANENDVPGLAVIIVGTRGDSMTYVNLKKRFATECGFHSVVVELPEDISQENLLLEVKKLNANVKIHGLLVQLPLPKHIDENAVVDAIDPNKDVDGLHPVNVGNLFVRGRTPLSVPCTPQGVIELLKRSHVQISGKRVAVLGRSNIVGLPVAQLLQLENATVTLCHSRTQNIESVVRECDIVVSAMGKAGLVKGDWIKEGAVIIDVGTNPVPDSSTKSGIKLKGDCEWESCSEKASLMTPVPGGCGPMTIAMLLKNTIDSFHRRRVFESPRAAAAAQMFE